MHTLLMLELLAQEKIARFHEEAARDRLTKMPRAPERRGFSSARVPARGWRVPVGEGLRIPAIRVRLSLLYGKGGEK